MSYHKAREDKPVSSGDAVVHSGGAVVKQGTFGVQAVDQPNSVGMRASCPEDVDHEKLLKEHNDWLEHQKKLHKKEKAEHHVDEEKPEPKVIAPKPVVHHEEDSSKPRPDVTEKDIKDVAKKGKE